MNDSTLSDIKDLMTSLQNSSDKRQKFYLQTGHQGARSWYKAWRIQEEEIKKGFRKLTSEETAAVEKEVNNMYFPIGIYESVDGSPYPRLIQWKSVAHLLNK